ncbi:mycofactocin precursor MftA [Streptomyces sp. JW3]
MNTENATRPADADVSSSPAEPAEAGAEFDDLSTESLIEEVSIDGMCGVY